MDARTIIETLDLAMPYGSGLGHSLAAEVARRAKGQQIGIHGVRRWREQGWIPAKWFPYLVEIAAEHQVSLTYDDLYRLKGRGNGRAGS